MVLPGSVVPDSNKRSRSRTAPARPAPRSASQRDAVLNNRTVEITPANPQTYKGFNSGDDDNPIEIYDHLQMTADWDKVQPINDGTIIHPPGLRSAYLKSPTYRERTLTEEAHWKTIIPEIFKCFMICSLKTGQWSNEATWNEDLNLECKCPAWKKGVVQIDSVDITMRWLLQRLSTSHSLYTKSCQVLNELKKDPMYTDEYLTHQWNRQRECQLQVLVKENSQEANDKLVALRRKRRRDMTVAEKLKLTHLTQTKEMLQTDIDELAGELGGDHYRDMPGSSNNNPALLPNEWMVGVVQSTKPTAKDRLSESKLVLQALYSRLSRMYTRLWIFWGGGMHGLINRTLAYSSLEEIEEASILTQWSALVSRSKIAWKASSRGEILDAAPLDKGEETEQRLMEFEAIVDEDEVGGLADEVGVGGEEESEEMPGDEGFDN
ncbi:uncharacterized protein MELLADRAFT_103751 [Melampsora larici-populina 98AG31]|uniref:CxC1-like cysteine cluster associated with KDZ transposases domain-containing protein n=1 Tax=Melampsora larici-populina (strain 98AG31 / pathotype 3-4-7) TaxID=747676 RepID=F4RC97_MELLP|nr:uncharacterized protein MELLADRAFT_103751 [Melampsora larici-populina 98AG31]EGG09990.1 hypothetical protein MELLADRAFT_103751 [Melampsora larici-populina 98AG31]